MNRYGSDRSQNRHGPSSTICLARINFSDTSGHVCPLMTTAELDETRFLPKSAPNFLKPFSDNFNCIVLGAPSADSFFRKTSIFYCVYSLSRAPVLGSNDYGDL